MDDSGRHIAVQWIDSKNHTGEDVGLFAMGKHSDKLCGLVQNTDIFTVMAYHFGFEKK